MVAQCTPAWGEGCCMLWSHIWQLAVFGTFQPYQNIAVVENSDIFHEMCIQDAKGKKIGRVRKYISGD